MLNRLKALIPRNPSRARSSERQEDQLLIATSALFDSTLYLLLGQDVRDAGCDAIEHFCLHGWREGRRPNLYFDPLWYQDRHRTGPDANPLAHYLRAGEAAGCRPISYFDPVWYTRTFRPPQGLSALAHYLAHRRSQTVAPNPHFDPVFYLARYGAEIGPNRDPFAHLLRCGGERDLDPSARFDSQEYRRRVMATQPEPAALMTWGAADLRVPLVHYLDAGYGVEPDRSAP